MSRNGRSVGFTCNEKANAFIKPTLRKGEAPRSGPLPPAQNR